MESFHCGKITGITGIMGYSGDGTNEAGEEIVHNGIDQLVSMLGQPIMGHIGKCRKVEGWERALQVRRSGYR